ncbi:MAG TPA: hypothetical protein VN541_21185, partial [Tepidisphaeraceae bacterium]|nr:hypothetical protein [Tepidisphaeraceae bacterium]
LMWSAGATMAPVLPIGLVVTFLLATRLVRYAFVNRRLPAELQERTLALGFYAQAPLAWLLVWAVVAASDHALQAADLERMWRELWILLKCVAGIAIMLATVGCAWSVVRVQMRLPQSSGLRSGAAGVWVPVSWAIAVTVGIGALPCLVGLTWIAIDSLR